MRILSDRLVTRWRVVECRQIGNRCRKSESPDSEWAPRARHASNTPRYHSHTLRPQSQHVMTTIYHRHVRLRRFNKSWPSSNQKILYYSSTRRLGQAVPTRSTTGDMFFIAFKRRSLHKSTIPHVQRAAALAELSTVHTRKNERWRL